MTRPTSRWRRGLFELDIAHLPALDPPQAGAHRRHDPALCGRYLRRHAPADEDTLRCPDCERLDAEPDI